MVFMKFSKHILGLHEKLEELDTYRDILVKQMDALQSFFELCSSLNSGSSEIHCEYLFFTISVIVFLLFMYPSSRIKIRKEIGDGSEFRVKI